jgi:hypothetical protein
MIIKVGVIGMVNDQLSRVDNLSLLKICDTKCMVVQRKFLKLSE